jgi:hypothetical protein
MNHKTAVRKCQKVSDNVVFLYANVVLKTHTEIPHIIHQGIDQTTLSSHDKQALR